MSSLTNNNTLAFYPYSRFATGIDSREDASLTATSTLPHPRYLSQRGPSLANLDPPMSMSSNMTVAYQETIINTADHGLQGFHSKDLETGMGAPNNDLPPYMLDAFGNFTIPVVDQERNPCQNIWDNASFIRDMNSADFLDSAATRVVPRARSSLEYVNPMLTFNNTWVEPHQAFTIANENMTATGIVPIPNCPSSTTPGMPPNYTGNPFIIPTSTFDTVDGYWPSYANHNTVLPFGSYNNLRPLANDNDNLMPRFIPNSNHSNMALQAQHHYHFPQIVPSQRVLSSSDHHLYNPLETNDDRARPEFNVQGMRININKSNATSAPTADVTSISQIPNQPASSRKRKLADESSLQGPTKRAHHENPIENATHTAHTPSAPAQTLPTLETDIDSIRSLTFIPSTLPSLTTTTSTPQGYTGVDEDKDGIPGLYKKVTRGNRTSWVCTFRRSGKRVECGQMSYNTRDRTRHLNTHARTEKKLIDAGELRLEDAIAYPHRQIYEFECLVDGCEYFEKVGKRYRVEGYRVDKAKTKHDKIYHPDVARERREKRKKVV